MTYHDLFGPTGIGPGRHAAPGLARRIALTEEAILRGDDTPTRELEACMEMGDGDLIVCALLDRGLRDTTFREALYRSRLIPLWDWLTRLQPQFRDRYATLDPKYLHHPPAIAANADEVSHVCHQGGFAH
jgi:hypothetical protein